MGWEHRGAPDVPSVPVLGQFCLLQMQEEGEISDGEGSKVPSGLQDRTHAEKVTL